MESSAFSRQLHRVRLGEEWKFTVAAAESVLFLLPAAPSTPQEEVRQSVTPAEPVQYYFTLAQQPAAVQVQGQQQGQQTTSSTTTIQPGQIIIAQPQQGQVCELQRVPTGNTAPLRLGRARLGQRSRPVVL